MGLFTRHSEFYDFARGAQHWRYTTDDRVLVYQAQTYAPQPGMKRDSIVLSQEIEKAALKITVPWDFPLLAIYRPTPPSQRVTATVYSLRKGTATADIVWTGVVTDIEDPDEHTSALHCAGGIAALATNGLNRKNQKACDRVLYGAGRGQCNKDPESVRSNATITGGSGVVLQAAAFAAQPAGWFNGGFIRWTTADGATEVRSVVSHVGDTCNLMTPHTLAVGALVAAYPGCDHTVLGGCTKLNNVINYGGQLYIPLKNPMGGDPIF